jgi:type II secretory pathway pseudopilin PulG
MHASTERGFSALEIVTVVAIIFILAAIVIPNVVSTRRSYNLRVAAEGLSQQLNRSRQEALRVNDRMHIRVTTNCTTQIDLSRDGNFDTDDGPVVRLSEEATITIGAPTSGIVTFNGRGEVPVGDPSPSFTVTSQGGSRTVTVDPRGGVIVGPET